MQHKALSVSWLVGVAVALCAGPASAVQCAGRPATIVGTPGPDLLIGTAANDVMNGLGGDDELRGRDGNDSICGYKGKDTIFGGAHNDVLQGGDGDDRIHGRPGDDLITGLHGNDVILGGPGDDEIIGLYGEDWLTGGSGGSCDAVGRNELYGGPGNDCVDGCERDRLFAGDFTDDVRTVYSNFDDMLADCGAGEDVLAYFEWVPPRRSCEHLFPCGVPQCGFCFLQPQTLATGKDSGARFEVQALRCGLDNVITEDQRVAATGQFCYVEFRVTNEGHDNLWLNPACQVLIDATGAEYSPEEYGSGTAMASGLDVPVARGVTVDEVLLVFDLPKGAIPDALRLRSACENSGFVVDVRGLDAADGASAYFPPLNHKL